MITRLPNDPLNQRARQVLTSFSPASKSWFVQIRDICLLYGMPHPLTLLDNPLTKDNFKKQAKSLVIDHWEKKLRKEATLLPSLHYLNPAFCSLARPHPILSTPGANPYEVAKAVVQLRMLSGRYKHWSSNKLGVCQSPSC